MPTGDPQCVCPSCGYCPTCGRRSLPYYPYYPYPWWPYVQPTIGPHWQLTDGTAGGGLNTQTLEVHNG